MLNIIKSPTGEARVRSGDGARQFTPTGEAKRLVGHEGEGCGPQKCCLWASQPTSRAAIYAVRPSNYSARPDGFQNYRARPGPCRALLHTCYLNHNRTVVYTSLACHSDAAVPTANCIQGHFGARRFGAVLGDPVHLFHLSHMPADVLDNNCHEYTGL